MKKRVLRVLSLMLVAATVVTQSGITTLAASLDGTDVVTEDAYEMDADEILEDSSNDENVISEDEILYAESEDEVLDEEIGDGEEVTVSEEASYTLSDPNYPDNDELFAGYVKKVMFEEQGIDASEYMIDESEDEIISEEALNSYIVDNYLNDDERKVYDFLLEKCKKIANGELDSSVVTIVIGSDLVLDNNSFSSNYEQEFAEALSLDKIMNALLYDNPYEMYWYNKTKGVRLSYSSSGNGTKYSVTQLTYTFNTSQDYAKSTETSYYPTMPDTSKTGAAANAAKNALTVVNNNKSKSDYEKLVAYKKYICDAVTYDTAAANSSGYYGDPWQLISVFDGNSLTNVVCEGYSKAFKYLCDLSSFSNSNIECIIMSGMMAGGTGAGGHMWNIIKMNDGKNYMVDVTNSDGSTVGASGGLFLNGYKGKVNDNTYVDYGSRSCLSYYYGYLQNASIKFYIDADLASAYTGDGASWLDWSSTDYNPNGGSIEEPDPEPVEYTITFNANGGSCSKTSMKVTENAVIGTLPTPTRLDYTFQGWYTAASGGTKVTSTTKYTFGKDITLYAQWEKNATVERTTTPSTSTIPEFTSGWALSSGNIRVKYDGTFFTYDVDDLLYEINKMRYEACQQGVYDSALKRALTPADYHPLAWTIEMETLARQRAVEQIPFGMTHTRPNGGTCFNLGCGSSGYSAENLAGNYNSSPLYYALMTQWYANEKKIYDNAMASDPTPRAVSGTGHYLNIVSAAYNSVGIACYKSGSGYYYSAMRLSSTAGTSAYNPASGNAIGYSEINKDSVSSISIANTIDSVYEVGNNLDLVAKAKLTSNAQYEISEGITWSSNNTSVATVNSNGRVTFVGEGKATVSWSAAGKTGTVSFNVVDPNNITYTFTKPAKTTYVVGESLSVAGGKLTPSYGNSVVTVTDAMVSGFNSSTTGVKTLTVTYDDKNYTYDVLVLEKEYEKSAVSGQTLSQIAVPTSAYGTFAWVKAGTTSVGNVGVNSFNLGFTSGDSYEFSSRNDIVCKITVTKSIENCTISGIQTSYDYTGNEISPAITIKDGTTTLTKGTHYDVDITNNTVPGTATVTITGKGYYTGSVVKTFEIKKYTVTITAENETIKTGDAIPTTYKYAVSGLIGTDKLTTAPVFTCSITSTEMTGEYDIVPSGAVAPVKYDIEYVKGKLTVIPDFTVTFDMNGHGDAISPLKVTEDNALITAPSEPIATGYTFTGWYKDAACSTKWNFETDKVSRSITLYAGWEVNKYQITFDACNGTANTVVTIAYGQKYQDVVDVNAINTDKEDHSFEGWYTEAEGGEQIDVFSAYYFLTDITLYAHYVNLEYDVLRVEDIDDEVFTGKAITPEVKVYYSGKLLEKGTEYTAVYKNNIKAGTATVVITGKTPFTGSLTKTFTIKPVSLTDEGITVDKIVVQNNNMVQKIAPVVYYKGTKLRANTDYNVEYNDNSKGDDTYKAAGEYNITINGNGNFTDSIVVKETIADSKLVTKLTVTVAKKKYNDGNAVYLDTNPANKELVVKDGTKDLAYGTDYTFSTSDYENNTRPGTASVTIHGLGNYYGDRKVNFTIEGIALSKVKFTLPSTVVYTGEEIKGDNLEIKAVYTTGAGASKVENSLTKGTDYEATVTNNLKVGVATVTFTGLGIYTGIVKKTFRVVAYNILNDTNSKMSVSYAMDNYMVKGGAMPAVTVKFGETVLTQNVDYTVAYKNNKTVATKDALKAPTITITGKGNFTGRVTGYKFNILPTDISTLTVYAPDKVYNAKKAVFKNAPVITDSDGKNIKSGADFDNKNIVYTYELDGVSGITVKNKGVEVIRRNGDPVDTYDIIPIGTTIKLTVDAKGNNYSGKASCTYHIIGTDIAKTKITVYPQYYTGRNIELTKSQVVVMHGKNQLSEADYKISNVQCNFTKMKGTFVIEGNVANGYGGRKTVTFKIVNRSFTKEIVFNGNGSTSGSMKNITVKANQNEYTLTANTFKRTGYTFAGWSTSPYGNVVYTNGQVIDISGYDKTALVLYAVWRKD